MGSRIITSLVTVKMALILICAILISAQYSCKKFLDKKPDQKLSTPTTVNQLQGFLDNPSYMNTKCSEAGEIASDNYYLSDAIYLSLSKDRERDAYLWKPGIFLGMSPTDWANEYNVVYNANLVLDNINNISRDAINFIEWDNCKGSALFFRAKSFYEIAQIWAKAYDSSTAISELGIPLRFTSDFNIKSTRSTIKETYSQIIQDFSEAIPLLPNLPQHPFRPSKAAAYGFLARTYLCMRNYAMAKQSAEMCLQIKSDLIDYNDLDSTLSYPFPDIPTLNPENIMHSVCTPTNLNLFFVYGIVDSLLYKSYATDDLRKPLFFSENADGSHYYRGSYNGDYANYNGIATDEIYLIRAECNARLGNPTLAINDLNTLLTKRWKVGTYVPFVASNSFVALNLVLIERRKELINRMARFTDIKRLNNEGANITLKRVIQGQTYTLTPNDPKFALPIPDNVIELSGIKQN
ncbi:MAG: RagB/SusD family nutrient uptake outer membrane protein [Chitinophagaceae bacterium]